MELVQSSPLALQIGVKQEALQFLTPVQMGWLEIAKKKTALFNDLEKGELAVQQELINIDVHYQAIFGGNPQLTTINEHWNKTVAEIKKAKELAATDKAARLAFTTMLQDGVIKASMEFEKRNDEKIKDAESKELKMRLEFTRKQSEGQNLESEKTALKTHIENEYFRIAAEYRTKLNTYIFDGYASALRAKTPADQLKPYIEQIATWMREEKLSEFQVFKRTHVNDADAMAIYQGVRPYDPSNDLQYALIQLDNKFAMYAEDLANADVALKANDEQLKQVVQNETEQTDIAIKTNELMSNASVTIETVGAPKIKRKKEVKVENSDIWAKNIISAFVLHWNSVRSYLAVKEWGNLKLSQMATALGKLATDDNKITFEGLELVNVEK